jgi:hypothetical protein
MKLEYISKKFSSLKLVIGCEITLSNLLRQKIVLHCAALPLEVGKLYSFLMCYIKVPINRTSQPHPL